MTTHPDFSDLILDEKADLKKYCWLAISNGQDIIASKSDTLKDYSAIPPEIPLVVLIGPRNYDKESRIDNRHTMLKKQGLMFDTYCAENNLIVQPALSGVKALFSRHFSQKHVESIYFRAKNRVSDWEEYDLQMEEYNKKLNAVVTIEQKKYEDEALKEWHRHYELQDFASLDKLSGIEFEHAIAGLYSKMGYTTKLTSSSGDFGVDVLATKDGTVLAIQAKRYKSTVGVSAVQEASSGKLFYKANHAMVVTNSTFTKNAKKLASESDVTLIDNTTLEALWTRYFPKKDIPEFDFKVFENTIKPKPTKHKN